MICVLAVLWTYLADLNEQVQRANESRRGRDRAHKPARSDGMGWRYEQHRNRAEEIILREMICKENVV